MLGAIVGDTIGSVYEWERTKETDFPLFSPESDFTDDSVLTVATAEAILKDSNDYGWYYKKYGLEYPGRGYGGSFGQWLKTADVAPAYDSYGNGSAMRISPIGFVFNTLEETLAEARISAACTHNHPEGIKGAQATAAAIWLARNGKSKEEIRDYIQNEFGYDMDRTCDSIRPSYTFHVTCQQTVPEAIIAFLDSTDFESAIRLAVSLGGDSDTLACITGGIAEAYYGGVPGEISQPVWDKLPNDMQAIIYHFYNLVESLADGKQSSRKTD